MSVSGVPPTYQVRTCYVLLHVHFFLRRLYCLYAHTRRARRWCHTYGITTGTESCYSSTHTRAQVRGGERRLNLWGRYSIQFFSLRVYLLRTVRQLCFLDTTHVISGQPFNSKFLGSVYCYSPTYYSSMCHHCGLLPYRESTVCIGQDSCSHLGGCDINNNNSQSCFFGLGIPNQDRQPYHLHRPTYLLQQHID